MKSIYIIMWADIATRYSRAFAHKHRAASWASAKVLEGFNCNMVEIEYDESSDVLVFDDDGIGIRPN